MAGSALTYDEMPTGRRDARRIRINGWLLLFTRHAVRRMEERDVPLDRLLRRVSGKPIRRWRYVGVVARRHHYHKRIWIITVWNPEDK